MKVFGLVHVCHVPFSIEHSNETPASESVHSNVETAIPFGSSGRVVMTGAGGATLSIVHEKDVEPLVCAPATARTRN